jgi:hypothetical protein
LKDTPYIPPRRKENKIYLVVHDSLPVGICANWENTADVWQLRIFLKKRVVAHANVIAYATFEVMRVGHFVTRNANRFVGFQINLHFFLKSFSKC